MGLVKIGKFPDVVGDIKRAEHIIPKVIAKKALNHFLQGFRDGGGKTNRSQEGWAKRASRAKRDKGRAILVDSGQLRRDIQVRRTTFDNIVIGTSSTPYAEYVNEGTALMPQREFLGDSDKLNSEVKRYLEESVKNILQGKKI